MFSGVGRQQGLTALCGKPAEDRRRAKGLSGADRAASPSIVDFMKMADKLDEFMTRQHLSVLTSSLMDPLSRAQRASAVRGVKRSINTKFTSRQRGSSSLSLTLLLSLLNPLPVQPVIRQGPCQVV